MSTFGKRPWGVSPFGSLVSAQTGVAEVKELVEDNAFGSASNDGTFSPKRVLSLTEFESSIKFGQAGETQIGSHLVSAFAGTLLSTPGSNTVQTNILKAKSWAQQYEAFARTYTADTLDLLAIVRAGRRDFSDMQAYVLATGATNTGDPQDLPAALQPLRDRDLPSTLAVIEAANLSGVLSPIPSFNLSGVVESIPGIDLAASSGAHPPEDVPAYLAAVLPVDLPVYIKGGFSDTLQLTASVVQQGAVSDLGVFLKLLKTTLVDISASVRVIGQGDKNLSAYVQPYTEINLPASITTQRISNLIAIISGVSPSYSDLSASIAKIDSAAFDVAAFTVAQFIALADVAGNIRVIQLGGMDVPSSLTSVFPFFNINKVSIQFTPLNDLPSVLIQAGGFQTMTGTVTPVRHAQTGTLDDAGFVVTASNYKFYLGTTRGVFIPPETVPEVRISTYTNPSQLPDLHATIFGWNQTDLTASLTVYPYVGLSASVRSLGFDHISDVRASIGAFNVSDVTASVTSFGSISNLVASATPAGLINDLNATIVAFVDPLALNVIPVSTQPLSDLSAMINYDMYVKCSPTSFISGLAAYIKPIVTGTPSNVSDLSASVTSSLVALDLTGEITGKKITRIRILSLTFTAKERGTEILRASVSAVHKIQADLVASVVGMLHEDNLTASIQPVRYALHDVSYTLTEKVANLATGSTKDVLISFRSQVQHYVYEEVTDSVYATDRGTWAIDVRTLLTDASFFDRAVGNREYSLTELQEYHSLDAAIRAGIVILCERRQNNLSASLQVRGKVADMAAEITAFSLTRVSDLSCKIMPVVNLPDITAQINTGPVSSSLSALSAILVPNYVQTLTNLSGEVFGDVCDDLSADITAV